MILNVSHVTNLKLLDYFTNNAPTCFRKLEKSPQKGSKVNRPQNRKVWPEEKYQLCAKKTSYEYLQKQVSSTRTVQNLLYILARDIYKILPVNSHCLLDATSKPFKTGKNLDKKPI